MMDMTLRELILKAVDANMWVQFKPGGPDVLVQTGHVGSQYCPKSARIGMRMGDEQATDDLREFLEEAGVIKRRTVADLAHNTRELVETLARAHGGVVTWPKDKP